VDLARRAGVSAGLVSLLERGHAELLTVRAIRRVATSLDVAIAWDAGNRGPALARLRDADHARLCEQLVRELEALGWTVAAEVSFNRYGDRGRIDLLAFDPRSRTLLVIEVKTVIADVQEVLGALHVKQRVSTGVARSMGWAPLAVVPMLEVVEGTTNRRRISAHARLFGQLALRGPAASAWLRQPSGAPQGILRFANLPNSNAIDGRRAGRQRVRVPRRSSSVGGRPRAPIPDP
jgi:transcriptional regulator with XRE-family HTH domain